MSFGNFSVLMSVYRKENPDFFYISLNSIWSQSLKPSEIVLVCDGPLSDELESVIKEFQNIMKDKLIVKRIKDNVGLGNALNFGLKYCTNNYIARMDTDDICVPGRFEEQLNYLNLNPDIVLLGSYIEEFDDDEDTPVSVKTVPLNNDAILKYAKKRNPFNHMSVVFKKTAVESVGGYENVPYFEDYYLWSKLLVAANKTANIPKVLVKARIGNGMVSRRGGLSYIKKIWNFRVKLHKLGFISLRELVIISLMQTVVAIIPNGARSFVYKHFLRK